MNDPLNATVLPVDERRAADLTDAMITGDGREVGDILAELVEVGAERTLATTALLARNLAAVLVTAHGLEDARLVLANTRWDAAVAEE